MVVLVIIGVLAALIVPNVLDRADDARATAARTDVANTMQALKLYKLDNQRFPTAEQGLQALVTKPTAGPIPTNWKPYLEKLPDNLEEKVKIGLYRIAQELVNNIIKHAGAGRVMMHLYLAGSSLILRVEDDGQGFDFETARNKGSMGLLNILSRVGHLGGAFHIETAQPHGAVSTVRIPVS